MSVRPIDMQININQAPEVARTEHARATAIAETQQALEKESNQKAQQVPSHLDENKKVERIVIKKDEFAKERRQKGKGEEKRKAPEEKAQSESETMGRIIDVRK